MTLNNWKARRSGKAMTVEGQNAATSEAVKLTNVVEIAAGGSSYASATLDNGDTVELLV